MCARAGGRTTIIENAAREAEIVDTANCVVTLGAKIAGRGAVIITIEGRRRLGGGVYVVLPDRIEQGTFAGGGSDLAAKILCRNAQPDTLDAVLAKRAMLARISMGEGLD